MKFRISGCEKFRYLSIQQEDRELTQKELDFYLLHKDLCDSCRREEEIGNEGLNLLRGATLEPRMSMGFEERVVRRLRVQRGRDSVRYWSPALAGAVLAGLILISALQLISSSGVLPQYDNQGVGRLEYEDDRLPLVIDPAALERS